MFNVKNHKPEKLPRQMPVMRPDGEPSPVQYASRSRRLSEEAALAAQHVLDMEHELKGVTTERDEERINREVVDRENLRLKDELARVGAQYEDRIRTLSLDRDYHRERYVEIVTRLNSVAKMLVDDVEQQQKQPYPIEVDIPPAKSLEDELARMVAAEHEAPRQ